MKKLLFTYFAILTLIGLKAQTETQNLQKYWKYRERFKKNYVVYHAVFDKSGTAIPANKLQQPAMECSIPGTTIPLPGGGSVPVCNPTYKSREWGDNLAHMDYYLSMLATEYHLLKQDNKPTQSVLAELYYAISAIDRLDAASDRKLIDLYDDGPSQNKDGFLLRDDVSYKIADLWENEFEYTNDNNDLAKCIKSDLMKSSCSPILQGTTIKYLGVYDSANCMSKDQIIGLTMGFTFIKRFVDNIYVQPSPNLPGFNIIDKIVEITDRIANRIVTTTTKQYVESGVTYTITENFVIRDPITDGRVGRGNDLKLASYPLIKAFEYITGNNYNKTFIFKIDVKINSNPVNIVNMQLNMSQIWNDLQSVNPQSTYTNVSNGITTYLSNYVLTACASSLAGPLGGVFRPNACIRLQRTVATQLDDASQQIEDNLISLFNMRMPIQLAISSNTWNKANMMNNWCSIFNMDIYDLAQTALWNDGPTIKSQSFYSSIINSAPTTGPQYVNASQTGTNWTTDNYFNNNTNPPSGSDYGVVNGGPLFAEFNGLDYMLLYNLYRICYNIPNTTYSNQCPITSTSFLDNKIDLSTNDLLQSVDIHGKFPQYQDYKIDLKEYITSNLIIPNGLGLKTSGQVALCNGATLTVNSGIGLQIGFTKPGTNTLRPSTLTIENGTLEVTANNRLSLINNSKLIIKSGSTFRIKSSSIIEVENGSSIVIEPGANFIIEPGAMLRLLGKNALFEIQDPNWHLNVGNSLPITITRHTAAVGGTFSFAGNLNFAANSTLTLNNVTLRCKGQINYGATSTINLDGDEAVLDIAGTLSIANNAEFKFKKTSTAIPSSGYIRFSSGATTLPNIIAGTGAKVLLQGASITDKIMEVTQADLQFPSNLVYVNLIKGLIENKHDGFGRIHISCSTTVSQCHFIHTLDPNTPKGRGLNIWYTGAFPVIIINSKFTNLDQGLLIDAPSYLATPYVLGNGNIFRNCKEAFSMYGGGGFEVNAAQFINNHTGVKYIGGTIASKVSGCTFKNTAFENTLGVNHTSPSSSYTSVDFSGSTNLSMVNNAIAGMREGLVFNANQLNLRCNTIKNNSKWGLGMYKGTLNTNIANQLGGYNDFMDNGYHHIYLSSANQPNLSDSYNYFSGSHVLNPNSKIYANSCTELLNNLFSPAPNCEPNDWIDQSNDDVYGTVILSGTDATITLNGKTGVFSNYIMKSSKKNHNVTCKRNCQDAPSEPVQFQIAQLNTYYKLNYTFTNPLTSNPTCGQYDAIDPCMNANPPCTSSALQACTTCSNVTTRTMGTTTSNVAADEADKKMLMTTPNNNRNALNLMNDILLQEQNLIGAGDPLVKQIVETNSMSAVGEGLKKGQLKTNSNQVLADLQDLYNHTLTHFNNIVDTTDEGKADKLKYYYRKLHLEKATDQIATAYITAGDLVNYINTLPSNIANNRSKKLASMVLCVTEQEKNFANGSITPAQFSLNIYRCQLAMNNSGSKLLGDAEDAFMPLPKYEDINQEKVEPVSISDYIIVSPNPTENRIRVKSTQDLGKGTITVLDLSGSKIWSIETDLVPENITTIDLNVKNGIYLVIIQSETGFIEKHKLVVLKNE